DYADHGANVVIVYDYADHRANVFIVHHHEDDTRYSTDYSYPNPYPGPYGIAPGTYSYRFAQCPNPDGDPSSTSFLYSSTARTR
ncbi:hypothetical protein, partial [Corynebacterium ulcerans]|uniref:hypothetical protein n=1 Tax=Corynebacterium ulcerans TaxID=65058 RepID=UPI0035A2230C